MGRGGLSSFSTTSIACTSCTAPAASPSLLSMSMSLPSHRAYESLKDRYTMSERFSRVIIASSAKRASPSANAIISSDAPLPAIGPIVLISPIVLITEASAELDMPIRANAESDAAQFRPCRDSYSELPYAETI